MQRFTVNCDDELKEVLERRARFQRRSLSAEVIFLIENALAHEQHTNAALLRMTLENEAAEAADQS